MTGAGLIPEAGATCEDDRPIGFYALRSARAQFIAKRAIDGTNAEKFKTFIELFLADYCSPVCPSFACAYRRAALVARHKDHPVPSLYTARRIMRPILSQIAGGK